ncbi:potassium channel beta, putative [Ixodes scapularis]|uniref:Potassium channel beta, putative n=1 Tax=Ixodes scapularis TaxID=6945 RepID=B7PTF3_IXOSC|nr:potassium channel beta, putative [Ixodes scapularis]|eukprot:XP_002404335.1 potassium channel beta, putative [Ixodes scapularis]
MEAIQLTQYISAVTDKVDIPEKAVCEHGGRVPRYQSKLQELSYIADRLGCTCNQLTIAWCLKCENVHTVLVGASSVDQLYDHLAALQEPWLGRPIPESPRTMSEQHIALECDDVVVVAPEDSRTGVQRFFSSVMRACVIQ